MQNNKQKGFGTAAIIATVLGGALGISLLVSAPFITIQIISTTSYVKTNRAIDNDERMTIAEKRLAKDINYNNYLLNNYLLRNALCTM